MCFSPHHGTSFGLPTKLDDHPPLSLCRHTALSLTFGGNSEDGSTETSQKYGREAFVAIGDCPRFSPAVSEESSTGRFWVAADADCVYNLLVSYGLMPTLSSFRTN